MTENECGEKFIFKMKEARSRLEKKLAIAQTFIDYQQLTGSTNWSTIRLEQLLASNPSIQLSHKIGLYKEIRDLSLSAVNGDRQSETAFYNKLNDLVP